MIISESAQLMHTRLVQPAEQLRDRVTEHANRMVIEYAGRWYRNDWDDHEPNPENHYFEWINTIKPQVVYDTPQVQVTSLRSGVPKVAPKAIEGALNWWSINEKLERGLSRVFDDAAFCFGVGMMTYEPAPGQVKESEDDIIRHNPKLNYINFNRFFCDPDCDVWYEARFTGHVWKADYEDLLEDPRYNKDALNELVADADLELFYGKNPRQLDQGDEKREIIGYEVWIPEIKLEGYEDDPECNGTIFTLATQEHDVRDGKQLKEARWIRDPRPSFGPSYGPYIVFGFHCVPGQPYPLSPFAATYDQIKELNAHAVAASRDAAGRKRLFAVDSLQPTVADDIENVDHNGVILVPNLDGVLKALEIGGTNREALEYMDRLRDRRDRVTGLDENARGSVDSAASATAVADAASQRDQRLALLKRAFNMGAVDVYNSAAWYFYTQSDAIAPLTPEYAEEIKPRPANLPPPEMAGQIAMSEDPPLDEGEVREALEWNPRVVYAGGPSTTSQVDIFEEDLDDEPTTVVSANIPGASFEDLQMAIKPYSMERVDQALLQKYTQEVGALFIETIPVMAQFPDAGWENLFDMIGKPMNMQQLSSQLELPKFLGTLRQQMQQQQQMGPMAMQGGPPAIAGSISPSGASPQPAAIQNATMQGQEQGRAASVV